MKVVLTSVILLLVIGANLGPLLATRLGLDHNLLVATLVTVTLVGLMTYRRLLVVLLVCGLSLSINLPAEQLAAFGIDKDFLMATVIVIIVMPFFGIKR